MKVAGIVVEVVYALPERQFQEDVSLPPGAINDEVIDASARAENFPEIDFLAMDVGVFGVRREHDWPLQDGDRVEIYRSLHVSPTEARRLRARASSRKENK